MWASLRARFANLRSSILCGREVPITSAWHAVGWWESRRVPFNLVVGTAGVLSCIVAAIVGLGSDLLFNSDFGLPNPPTFALLGILIYGVMANICFTRGWLAELLIRKVWPQEADRFATLSFSLGLVFSVLLTLTPGIIIGAGGVLGLLAHIFGVVHSNPEVPGR